MFKVFKKKTGSKTHKKNYRRKTRKSRKSRKSRNSKYRQKRNLKNNYRKKRSRKRVGAGFGPNPMPKAAFCNHIYGNIGPDGLVKCRKCGDKKYPIKPSTINYNNAIPNMNYQYGYEGTKPIGPLGTTNRGKIDYGPYHVPVKSSLTRRKEEKKTGMDSLGKGFGNMGLNS